VKEGKMGCLSAGWMSAEGNFEEGRIGEDAAVWLVISELFWNVSDATQVVFGVASWLIFVRLQLHMSIMPTLGQGSFRLVTRSLLCSTGIIPLAIIVLIPDIMRHLGDVIVRAAKENPSSPSIVNPLTTTVPTRPRQHAVYQAFRPAA
jgi:hypothetical protein